MPISVSSTASRSSNRVHWYGATSSRSGDHARAAAASGSNSAQCSSTSAACRGGWVRPCGTPRIATPSVIVPSGSPWCSRKSATCAMARIRTRPPRSIARRSGAQAWPRAGRWPELRSRWCSEAHATTRRCRNAGGATALHIAGGKGHQEIITALLIRVFRAFLLTHAGNDQPILLAAGFLIGAVFLFAMVTLHEFGHAFACRQVGGSASRLLSDRSWMRRDMAQRSSGDSGIVRCAHDLCEGHARSRA